MPDLPQALSPEALQLLLVLFLSFLIGLEREGHHTESAFGTFGGVRTFPLIGLLGYGLALLSNRSLLPEAIGLVAVALLMAVSLQHKFATARAGGTSPGATSELSGLLVYVIGVLVQQGFYWLSATLAIVCLLLLELKAGLERLSRTVPSDEVLTLAKFLALSVVLLPLAPDRDFGPFSLNPFKTWLVVVAVTGVSYGSYLLQRFNPAMGGVRLTAILGGAYSSTFATVALARKSTAISQPHLVSGSILMATGMTYLRLALLVGLFNPGLLRLLAMPFLALAAIALGGGWLWSRRADNRVVSTGDRTTRNPLELSAAFLFAALFVAMQVATKLTVTYLGSGGIYTLAALVGVTNVDPFVLGLAQGGQTPLLLAAGASVVATASNSLVKGIYGRTFADPRTGTQALGLLGALAIVGLVPLLWLR